MIKINGSQSLKKLREIFVLKVKILNSFTSLSCEASHVLSKKKESEWMVWLSHLCTKFTQRFRR